jgi:ribokinase
MNKNKLLVIGSLNMDLVVNVPQMPKVGETILGENFKAVAGGKGANQAFAASKLCAEVYMLGKIGTDEYGQALLDSLNSAGVNTEGIEKQSGTHTGLASICVNSDGDNSIVVIPGANNTCSKEYIYRHISLIEMCDIVILQLEIPFDVVSYIIEIAKKMNKTVILNPAPAPNSLPDSMLAKVDIITPNETELQKLTGMETNSINEIKKAAKVLLDKGVKTVIVTWGDKGAVLATNNQFKVFPTTEVRVVDTTAAGDTFTAAIAVAISENKTLGEAIEFANRVAAVVVTREGAQTSIPTKDEVENLFNSNK